jgi:hypothetical protein
MRKDFKNCRGQKFLFLDKNLKKDGVISHSIANFLWVGGVGVKLVSCTVFHSKQELLGQFSSTVELKLYH